MSGSVCDWLFEAQDVEDYEGDVHTPDYRLDGATSCMYTFLGEATQRVTVKLAIYKLQYVYKEELF